MTTETHPVGPVVDPKPPGTLPDLRPLPGRWARLDALNTEKHGAQLWHSIDGKDEDGKLWTYMAFGPFANKEAFDAWLKARQVQKDAWFYAYVKRDTGEALGMGSFMRADPANGAIEIGSIWLSKALQKTREGTEVIYLMMRHAFDDLGSRRLEWKCDALNAPSRRAALRYGFKFEGIFQQHMIIKGKNRDTAWFAMLDKDWPQVKKGFEAWLAESNFDANGNEKSKLKVPA
ncbi:GNAT family N-acetyltransferase [Aestuariivirga litoralis]|uniref:GNAT family N-acetyltransferase n=1 Tax=Aestuariivirga litoralis TaxID=2650924 RepID=UPI0018C6DDF7|nr:GNAT family protein [Aestuariivirga litoralis]MBG1231601.1 GNAT family N-acetyltransferase [Aestuariivirga litoralis]